MKKIIGLTGGIGSGKSTVAAFLETRGYPVYYSDERAKSLVNEDEFLKNQIVQLLGENAYDDSGLYDRKYVGGLVFNDSGLLEKLNATVHPAVKYDFERWTDRQSSEIIFKETALLFELKLNESCYKTVLVTAEDNLRMKRVMDRDGKTYREVAAIMEKQMPEKDKIALADFVIYNNSDLQHLEGQTENILRELTV